MALQHLTPSSYHYAHRFVFTLLAPVGESSLGRSPLCHPDARLRAILRRHSVHLDIVYFCSVSVVYVILIVLFGHCCVYS